MKETKHNKFVCFVLKNVQNRRIYAIVSIYKQQQFLSFLTKHSCLKFRKNHQIRFKSSRKHHTKSIWTKIESEISSLNQKSDFWSSIFETFFSLENFSNLHFIFLAKRSLFHINSIISISNQKIVQHFIWKSFIFTSAFDIAIIFLFEKQFENVSIDFNKTIFFFNFCDKFNISFSKQWSDQKFNHYIRNFRSNFHFFERISNHLFASRIFQNFIYFINKSIVFFIHSISSIFH